MQITAWDSKMPSFRTRGIQLTIVAMFTIGGSTFAGETIRDSNCQFTLQLPDGFSPCPTTKKLSQFLFAAKLAQSKPEAKPELLYLYSLEGPKGDWCPVMLHVLRLPTTVKRVVLGSKPLPADLKDRISVMKWQGFDVLVMELPGRIWNRDSLGYFVEIGLKPYALQVLMLGPADRKQETRALLQQVLDGLHGETNWVHPSVRHLQPTPAFVIGQMTGTAVLVCVSSITLLRLSYRLPKGLVLILALSLCCILYSIDMNRLTCLLAGLFGACIGVGDLFRRRKPSGMPPLRPIGLDGRSMT